MTLENHLVLANDTHTYLHKFPFSKYNRKRFKGFFSSVKREMNFRSSDSVLNLGVWGQDLKQSMGMDTMAQALVSHSQPRPTKGNTLGCALTGRALCAGSARASR